jgi:hypothetical protein
MRWMCWLGARASAVALALFSAAALLGGAVLVALVPEAPPGRVFGVVVSLVALGLSLFLVRRRRPHHPS